MNEHADRRPRSNRIAARARDACLVVITAAVFALVAASSPAQVGTCGNGTVEPGEDCDPIFSPCVNPVSGLMGTCDVNCRCSTCNNGSLEPYEQCDPSVVGCPQGAFCTTTCICLSGPATTVTTSSTTTTTLLDHFQCYEIKPAAFSAPPVVVEDQFATRTESLRYPHRLCAPADKNGEGIGDSVQHLVGYSTRTPPYTRQPNQVVVNQFGTLTLDVTRPDVLMVPAAKSLAGPAVPLTPPTIDHFQCYKVKRTHGTAKFTPRTVSVADQLETITLTVKRPALLCAPANKNGEDPTAPSHDTHLLCYKTRATARFGTVPASIATQFGADDVVLIHRRELCLPSSKNPGSSTTSTTTTATTTSSPSTTTATTTAAPTTTQSTTIQTTTTITTSTTTTTLYGSPSRAFLSTLRSLLD